MTTHASRNPTKPLQKTRHRVGRPSGALTESQKATRALQAAQRKIKLRELEEDIDAFFEGKEELVARLVKKHSKSSAYIKGLLNAPSQYRATRAINIRNAVVHDLALRARERELSFF